MRNNAVRAAFLAAFCLFSGAPVWAGIPPQSGGPSQAPPANDEANAVISGTITAATACNTGTSQGTATTGCSSWFMPGPSTFNVVFGGASGPNGSYSATLEIDRSFDGGTTWYVAGVGGGGQQAIYSTANQDVSVTVQDPERGVLYRLRCTSYSSGTISYRLSTTAGATPTFGH